MCLVFFALKAHPGFPLLLAGNRDEFYDRPTAPAAFWAEDSRVLAGKDLKENGTWMGVTRQGRWAAITNFRDPASVRANAPSRGGLVLNFLQGREPPGTYLAGLLPEAGRYNAFNLVAGQMGEAFCLCSRQGRVQALEPGIYGLSNRFLDTPWPKVIKAKNGFQDFVRGLPGGADPDFRALFELLSDTSVPPDSDLPDTGVGLDWERMLGSIFICSKVYGTRSSMALAISASGTVFFEERTTDRETLPAMALQNRINRFVFPINHEKESVA